MRRSLVSFVLLVPVMLLAACQQAPQGHDVVHLPEGDPTRGEEHFVMLGCISCHKVIGADLPEPAVSRDKPVLLGSTTGREMTYNQMITSIVNPSHRLTSRYRKELVSEGGESTMRTYNDVMTVTQLADLVAFLDVHYTKIERPGYKYRVYDYGAESEADGEGEEE